jgi:hypothetical protein
MVFGWSVISSPGIHPRWLPLLKIEISLNCKNILTFFWNSRKFELLPITTVEDGG